MNTIVKKSGVQSIMEAAEILRSGGLVAFPTETVYGLGANALCPSAVKRIFEAKGRPPDNPLILHISAMDDVYRYAADVPNEALLLAEAFWPGPLTMVLRKSAAVPYETSGGLETAAIRFPANKAAAALIQAAGFPIAAPSANSSGKPSPTQANHVYYDLNGKIDMIIDGGDCLFGLESTIVDCTVAPPCLLRPGAITVEMIEQIIGAIQIDSGVSAETGGNRKPRAPGMMYAHYSPIADLTVVTGTADCAARKINQLCARTEKKAGIMATNQTAARYDHSKYTVISVGDRNDESTIAANLFNTLRKFDFLGVGEVFAEGFEERGIGLAIMNRLKKAAGYNVIHCEGDELL